MRLRDRIPHPNIFRVYETTFALGVAYGTAISVIAIFLDQRGFDKAAIGELAAWFAAGIVALSLPMGGLIRRFSAKNVLVLALAGYALTVSIFPFLHSFWALAALRFFDGAFSVGIWVGSETILLSRANREHKAFVTSLYAISISIGYVVGPVAARLSTAVFPLAATFLVSGGIAALSSLYAALRLQPEPRGAAVHGDGEGGAEASAGSSNATGARASTWEILFRIKNSCFATFSYGYFQASVVLFLPLYLMQEKGIEKEQTILIPAFFAGGMLLFSNYAGRLGDRLGHLAVMRVLAVIGLAMILGFVFLDSYPAMCAAVFVAGGSLASISPVSLALQGVISNEYGRATALYNAFYAAGMLLGPPISSLLFQTYGGAMMLYQLAALWLAFVLFSILFYRDDPAVRRSEGAQVLIAKPPAE